MDSWQRTLADTGYSPARGYYEGALDAARAARGSFFRQLFSLAGRSLKGRICPRLEKWHLHLCH